MTFDFWKEWAKPWSHEQCEERYVLGSAIRLKDLNKVSEVPLSTLLRWSASEHWVALRKAYVETMGDTTVTGQRNNLKQFKADLNNEVRKRIESKSAEKVNVIVEQKQNRGQVLDEASIKLATIKVDLAIEHAKAAKAFRKLAEFVVTGKLLQIEEARNGGQIELRRVSEATAQEGHFYNFWSLILDRATKAEADAVGLRYDIDLNEAYASLKRKGYQVLDPSEFDN